MGQVQDDVDLLNIVMADQSSADILYRPTNYWSQKCAALASWIAQNSLKDYRRIRAQKKTPPYVLNSFGAVDLNIPVAPEDMRQAVIRNAEGSPAIPLDETFASEIGNPEGFLLDGKFYTYSWLNFYLRYAYVARHINLSGKIIVEIGPGSGKQAHLLKRAHPDITIILFDIAPQIYVANQYLKAVFANSDQVVGYREARNITSFEQIQRGKITIMGAWKAPILKDQPIDLLWNAASFQEMEPNIVHNYLNIAGRAESVYLMQTMIGQGVAAAAGKGGVLEKTTLDTYESALPHHKMIDMRPAALALPAIPKVWNYSDTFWRKQVN